MPPINLYSDTQTRPTAGMRAAIARAEVGDEQRRRDPTTTALQERVAELLGHEAAVFLPSGTMCNEVALRIHVRPGGDEIICDSSSHPVVAEAGGPAQLAGAMVRTIDGDGGVFTGEQVEHAIRTRVDRYAPRSRVVSVEQTTNMGGGHVWPLQTIHDVLAVARRSELRAHLDGARLMNAVVASGVAASEYARGFDTAWLDFTKGLGAPVGAVLVGSQALIDEAWRWKQMLGGALRQSGIVAAACLYALDHHVDRLAEDHEHARRLAEGLSVIPGVRIDPSQVETNIVIFEVADAPAFVARLADQLELGALDAHRVRAVTHLDVSAADIDRALSVISDRA
ncbi:MAG TPA: threonine aldolase family protein [Solirubrobacteraceae bacterium]|nr:threonine aldolase family protein [Solirubrobacteraceae bacterium]